jgi:hypothetical protein
MTKQQRQSQAPQYYTAITQFPDPDRLAKLLELGDPNFFGSSTTQVVGLKSAALQVPKLSNASVTTTDEQNDTTEDRVSKLLKLGDVNFFGGSPLAEALAARQRGYR